MGGLTWSSFLTPITHLFKSTPAKEIQAIKETDHGYIRGNESQRSPCPFLNSLANHGYLPRDGQDITRSSLEAALIVAGNSTPLFANILTSVVTPLIRKDGTFSLVDLRRHNAIEHDASFTRLDFRQGDNYSFQPAMFEAFLADAGGGPISTGSLARTRRRRDAEEKQAGHGAGVTFWRNPSLWFTMWSQTCILLQTFGEQISVADITLFYEEERLPDWWTVQARQKKRRMTFIGQLGDIFGVYWRHFFVKVPEIDVKNPLRGW